MPKKIVFFFGGTWDYGNQGCNLLNSNKNPKEWSARELSVHTEGRRSLVKFGENFFYICPRSKGNKIREISPEQGGILCGTEQLTQLQELFNHHEGSRLATTEEIAIMRQITGDNRLQQGDSDTIEECTQFRDDVIRIHIKGCQDPNVGGSANFPNLDIVANKIRRAFDGKKFNAAILRRELGSALFRIEGVAPDAQEEIDEIALEGFSRGAVTTFAVAKKIDSLDIPIHIIANQPVPGQYFTRSPRSPFTKYSDLSRCRNIQHPMKIFITTHDLEQNFKHNKFFRLMLPKVNPYASASDLILLPYPEHFAWKANNIRPVDQMIALKFKDLGWTDMPREEIDRRLRTAIEKEADIAFTEHGTYELYRTPEEHRQPIHGHEEEHPLHPSRIFLEVIEAKTLARARAIIVENELAHPVALSSKSAEAILVIDAVDGFVAEDKKRLIQFAMILEDDPQREAKEKFIDVICKIHEKISFLVDTTHEEEVDSKSAKIKTASQQYRHDVYLAMQTFLSSRNPTIDVKSACLNTIHQAHNTFEDQALSIYRNKFGIVVKSIMTALLTILTLGFYRSELTTRSTAVMQENTSQLMKDIYLYKAEMNAVRENNPEDPEERAEPE